MLSSPDRSQSLFPKNVKERLLEEKANEIKAAAEANKQQRHKQKSTFTRGSTASQGLQDFVEGTDTMDNSEQEILETDPIADVFPEATILFADLVGFSKFPHIRCCNPFQPFQPSDTVIFSL